MTANSRGLMWLRLEGHRGPAHAFQTYKDGSPVPSSLCGVLFASGPWVLGSRRERPSCQKCSMASARIPKQIGDPCATAQPNGRGSACRNCGFSIRPTYPGWVHVTRAAA